MPQLHESPHRSYEKEGTRVCSNKTLSTKAWNSSPLHDEQWTYWFMFPLSCMLASPNPWQLPCISSKHLAAFGPSIWPWGLPSPERVLGFLQDYSWAAQGGCFFNTVSVFRTGFFTLSVILRLSPGKRLRCSLCLGGFFVGYILGMDTWRAVRKMDGSHEEGTIIMAQWGPQRASGAALELGSSLRVVPPWDKEDRFGDRHCHWAKMEEGVFLCQRTISKDRLGWAFVCPLSGCPEDQQQGKEFSSLPWDLGSHHSPTKVVLKAVLQHISVSFFNFLFFKLVFCIFT